MQRPNWKLLISGLATVAVGTGVLLAPSAMATRADSLHLTSFTTAPSATQITLGATVTDQATAVGNSTLGLPAAPITVQNVSEVATSAVVGGSKGAFDRVRPGDVVTGPGIPAGSTVTAPL